MFFFYEVLIFTPNYNKNNEIKEKKDDNKIKI